MIRQQPVIHTESGTGADFGLGGERRPSRAHGGIQGDGRWPCDTMSTVGARQITVHRKSTAPPANRSSRPFRKIGAGSGWRGYAAHRQSLGRHQSPVFRKQGLRSPFRLSVLLASPHQSRGAHHPVEFVPTMAWNTHSLRRSRTRRPTCTSTGFGSFVACIAHALTNLGWCRAV